MTILVCAPHPDDEVIGMGGTIAKYSSEGERVVAVIFSLGEASHPWQRKEEIQATRKQEAIEASSIAGISRTEFLKLTDTQIGRELNEKNMDQVLYELIKEEKPTKIFLPALDDVHKDHRSVAQFMLTLRDTHHLKAEFWMYTVWSPFFVKHRGQPRLVIDITKHFPVKWKAIAAYKSQKVSTFQLVPTVMLRGLLHGLRFKMTMAEVFLLAPTRWK